MKRRLVYPVAALLVALATGGVASAASAATLNGAGSTLVAPIEASWASAFQSATGNTVNYNAVGSGTGIADVSQGLVDFGASDAPLNSTQAAACHGCIMIPWALSATGVGFHIQGFGNKLRLNGPVLAGIYLGQITNWDDPQIKKLNKGAHLPNLKITPVFRSDGSGDTYAFTNYLNNVSSSWAHRVGYSTSVGFPTGVGGKGNSGVTAILESTNGAIAYVAVSYLIAHSLPAAAVQNAAGRYEYPNLSEISAAAHTVKHVTPGTGLHIVDPPKKAKTAYPISTFTYAIVPTGAAQGSLLQQFISFAISKQGQSFGPHLDFAPLPKKVIRADKTAIAQIH